MNKEQKLKFIKDVISANSHTDLAKLDIILYHPEEEEFLTVSSITEDFVKFETGSIIDLNNLWEENLDTLENRFRHLTLNPHTYVVLDEHKKVIGGFQSFELPFEKELTITGILAREHDAYISDISIDKEKREGLDSHFFLCSYRYHNPKMETPEKANAYIHKVIMS